MGAEQKCITIAYLERLSVKMCAIQHRNSTHPYASPFIKSKVYREMINSKDTSAQDFTQRNSSALDYIYIYIYICIYIYIYIYIAI